MNKLILASTAVGVFVAACNSPTAPQRATIDFALVAPLCSSVIPVQFSLDGIAIGADTFRVNLPGPRTLSRGFAVAPGTHEVSARTPWGRAWPDVELIRNIFIREEGRAASNFEVVASIAAIAGIRDHAQVKEAIRTQIAFLKAWKEVQVAGKESGGRRKAATKRRGKTRTKAKGGRK